jgi:hypothetical protein
MNSVTLYSNGTAVISREYHFQGTEPLRIPIPVRKTDLDDVISSLTVFGDVTLPVPPTYTPINAQETELTLNPDSVLQDLATKLAGAAVEIDAAATYQGKLAGLHHYRREVQGSVVEQCRIVVLTAKGFQQFDEASISAIRFTDPLVQAEVDKALQANLSLIKPDSSMVEMTLIANPGTNSAFVTYATPVAAWKIRYQLRLTSTSTELEGQAIIDNDTDDDWTETLITVVTGEPITFSTDLAEIRRPERNRVKIVSDRTTGAVAAAPTIAEAMAPKLMAAPGAAASGAGAVYYSMDLEAPRTRGMSKRAVQVQADVQESGDFSIFRSPNPVSIKANRSAIIPLFRTAISEAQALLFYRERDDAERPFRAVRLKNQTAHSLGRGVCEIYLDGDFQGKCVMQPTKPDEEVLLIHAKETGVRVSKDCTSPESRRMAIRISAGVAYYEDLSRQQTIYQIRNSHATAFTLEIEHPRMLRDSKLEIAASCDEFGTVDIPNGQRIRVSLESKGQLQVKVTEVRLERQEFALNAYWLAQNVIDLKNPVSHDPAIQQCVDLNQKLDTLQNDLKVQINAAKVLDEEQKRLMKLIPNGHLEQANEWRTDLATAENELRDLKKTVIPQLKQQIQDTEYRLNQSLSRLQFQWASDGPEQPE